MLTSLSDPAGPLSWLVIVGLVFLSAFFSGCEVVYNYANRYKIKIWADDGKKSAKLAIKVIEMIDNTVIAILIGNNIVNIASSILASTLLIALMGPYGSVVSTICLTIVIFIFGEILPKNIARANANKLALVLSYPIFFLMIVFTPLTLVFKFIVFVVSKMFRLKENTEEVLTEDDFQDIIEKISDDGIIDEDEGEIIIAAIDWGDTLVGEVLTKRSDIVAIDIKNCNEKYINEFIVENSYSRIPVYEGSINNIIGILHVRMYLKELFNNKKVNIKDILLKPYIVSPKIKIDEIFEGFKEHQTHIAIVKEKNRTIGMVTMKDILEELVSNIDEANTSDEEGGAE